MTTFEVFDFAGANILDFVSSEFRNIELNLLIMEVKFWEERKSNVS